MSSVTKIIAAVAAILTLGAVLLSTGCGGSSNNARLRVLQGSPNLTNTVNVLLNNNSIASNLAYAANTGYLSAASGSSTFTAELTGNPTPFVTQSIALGASSETTIILSNFAANVAAEVYIDDNLNPPSGEFGIRVINSSPTMGACDVYIVPAGTSLGGTSPSFSALNFEQSTTYFPFAAGAYEIFLTAPNTKSVYVDTGQISFTSGQNRTIVALNASATGGYTSVTLADLD